MMYLSSMLSRATKARTIVPKFKLHLLFPLGSRAVSALPELVDEEKLSGYNSSTHYPVKLGDVFQDTYIVKAKLGFGRNSTTWLCTDQTNSFKVLKLLTARDGESREATIFKHLRCKSVGSQNQGRYCVRRAEDIFTISVNGNNHQCFIFEPLGPSLTEYVSGRMSQYLHVEEVRWMVIYFLHAVAFLHEHNVVHADIKLDNIQLMLPDNEPEFLSKFVASAIDNPSSVKATADGLRIYRSRQMGLHELTYPILCDLGSAMLSEPPHHGMAQALPYRAPEIILGAGWDCKIDIWSLGVLVWELTVGERLFGQSSEVDSLELMIRYLGPPPESLLLRCSRRATYFDDHGHWKHGNTGQVELEDRVEMETEMPLFFSFLRSMLTWDPNQRLSAAELLNHPWLQLE